MIIRISLFLTAGAVFLLLWADLFSSLGLRSLADIMMRLGSLVLLSAFSLFFVNGLTAAFLTAVRAAAGFYSPQNRLQRQLLFIQASFAHTSRLYYFRKAYAHYRLQQHIKRLSDKNHQQQLESLFETIGKELLSVKSNIPSSTYRQLQQESKKHRNRRDVDGFIKLQQKISAFF